MEIQDGVLNSANQKVSPNFNERPSSDNISLLVIHNISLPAGQFGNSNVIDLFTNKLDLSKDRSFQDLDGVKVSAHLFIRRDGEIIQFVNFNDRAWHAGVSSFQGQVNCNDFSIGIELEGTDFEEYTAIQYQQLVKITKYLMAEYPKISIDRICGHCDIAPDRKTDPGTHFNWRYYKSELSE